MNTPDQIFKLQTQLSTWSGTKKVAGWLALISFALCAVGVVLIIIEEERSVGALASPLFLVGLFIWVRTQAKKKISDIEAELSS